MGVSNPTNVYGSIRTLEDRWRAERKRGDRWRTATWVAIFLLAAIALLSGSC